MTSSLCGRLFIGLTAIIMLTGTLAAVRLQLGLQRGLAAEGIIGRAWRLAITFRSPTIDP
jgi:hypothetical protein